MLLEGIKVLKIDITNWLIKSIRLAKEHNNLGQKWSLNEAKDIISFELWHKDFDFYIDFDLYYDNCHVGELDVDCRFNGKCSHVSDLYPDTEMIDFGGKNDNRLKEIYSAVLSHF